MKKLLKAAIVFTIIVFLFLSTANQLGRLFHSFALEQESKIAFREIDQREDILKSSIEYQRDLEMYFINKYTINKNTHQAILQCLYSSPEPLFKECAPYITGQGYLSEEIVLKIYTSQGDDQDFVRNLEVRYAAPVLDKNESPLSIAVSHPVEALQYLVKNFSLNEILLVFCLLYWGGISLRYYQNTQRNRLYTERLNSVNMILYSNFLVIPCIYVFIGYLSLLFSYSGDGFLTYMIIIFVLPALSLMYFIGSVINYIRKSEPFLEKKAMYKSICIFSAVLGASIPLVLNLMDAGPLEFLVPLVI